MLLLELRGGTCLHGTNLTAGKAGTKAQPAQSSFEAIERLGTAMAGEKKRGQGELYPQTFSLWIKIPKGVLNI